MISPRQLSPARSARVNEIASRVQADVRAGARVDLSRFAGSNVFVVFRVADRRLFTGTPVALARAVGAASYHALRRMVERGEVNVIREVARG